MKNGPDQTAENRRYPGLPRWVKLSGIVLGTLTILLTILTIAGGGRHGPFRHFSPTDTDRSVPTSDGQGSAPTGSAVEE